MAREIMVISLSMGLVGSEGVLDEDYAVVDDVDKPTVVGSESLWP